MSSEIAVQVRHLAKCYNVYEKPIDRLKQVVVPRVKSILGKPIGSYYREFWALRDVSFDIYKGETVGIIGRNGSGKSTLLQMICGTLEPTLGSVETFGRVAALLELGAGFNQEFTGRENVFLNASVLGLSKSEIESRFNDIAEFADIGDFIDQPVKRYSSGMYARLAFSVAINVDPDILIVDEALAVGDEPFQRKCFARIDQIKRNGGTILFVSHSGGTIINLCDRAILLNNGERLYTGTPKKAVFFSQKLGNSSLSDSYSIIEEIKASERLDRKEADAESVEQVVSDAESSLDIVPSPLVSEGLGAMEFYDSTLLPVTDFTYEEDGAAISMPVLETMARERANHIVRGRRYRLKCTVSFDRDCPSVRFYALIRTTAGIDLAGCAHPILGEQGLDFVAGDKISLDFEFDCKLNPATYFCNFAIQGQDGALHHRMVDALVFRVIEDSPRPATGLIDIDFEPKFSYY